MFQCFYVLPGKFNRHIITSTRIRRYLRTLSLASVLNASLTDPMAPDHFAQLFLIYEIGTSLSISLPKDERRGLTSVRESVYSYPPVAVTIKKLPDNGRASLQTGLREPESRWFSMHNRFMKSLRHDGRR